MSKDDLKQEGQRVIHDVINRIYLWIISFGILSDGLIGVITIGFIRTKIGLYGASKYAKWKHRVKYGL